jgi:hypothetical protein
MKYKNAALAVLVTASLAVAVQDFGVPPGIPNVFSAGEVAVADDVNENFEWVENALDALDLVNQFQDDQIDEVEYASKQRTQSFAALGYFISGDSGKGPLPKGTPGEDSLGGASSTWLGWLNIPVPQDWDIGTEMIVTVTMLNEVNSVVGQFAQDIEVDIYGDVIGSGEPAFEDSNPLCWPGPDCGYDFYSNCFISVPNVQADGPPLFQATSGFGNPEYIVSATFTIGSSPLFIGSPSPRQIKINFFEPSNPLVMGQKGGGGGGGDPVITLVGPAQLNPGSPPCFVSLEYTTL